MTFKLNATNFQNVSPGNTGLLTLPVGKSAPTLDKLLVTLGGGLTPDKILSVVGKANGRIFFEESAGAVAIKKRDAYRGIFTEAGFLTLDFTEPRARNGAVEQLLASIPMGLLQKLQFEFKLDATAAVGSTLTAQMQLRQPTNNPYILIGFDGGTGLRDACRAPLTRKSDGTSVNCGFSVRSRSLIKL
jgi:hypothetical protein